MIGSEGTLGFISRITYRTVAEDPYKASALIFFPDIERLPGRDPPEAAAGGRGRTARPRGAALGGGQARHAAGDARRWATMPPRC